MITVHPVDTEYINQTWPLVEGFLKSGLKDDISPLYVLEHVRGFLTSGQWLLIVGVDEENKILGALTVSFSNYPLHRVAYVTAIGGKNVINNSTMAQFKDILKARGATLIQAQGKESIVRLWRRYKFSPRYTLVETLL